MWFKNLQIYRVAKTFDGNAESVATCLERQTLQACGSSDVQSVGWVPVRQASGLMHVVNRQWLLALGVEKKVLPASVIKDLANEKAKKIEETEGRRVGRREMRDLIEGATNELLPRAFVQRRKTYGWLDPVNGWLVVDATSRVKAEEFLEHLRKTVDGIPITLVKTVTTPTAAMTGWVAAGESTASFTIDQDLHLASAEDAQVRYMKHSLEGEDVRQQIADGKVATKLAMTWNDRVSFILTDALELKRVAFLDIVKEQSEGQAENDDERFDIDFTLMTGEVAKLLADVVAALGGELEN